jgi:outer membrane lipoprotein
MHRRFTLISIFTGLMVLAGIVGADDTRRPPAQDPDWDGPSVQWVGKIMRSLRDGDDTCFELYGPLDAYDSSLSAPGRFIACSFGYYDPSVFAAGHRLAVNGNLSSARSYTIAGETFSIPLVVAANFTLLPDQYLAPSPYWRDPFHDPFWGLPPYPYPPPFPHWRYWR